MEQQVGQVVQSMAAEAGFDVKLQAAEANALVAAGRSGNYQATIVIWSGRPDPDGNVAIWLACDGFLNWGKYCNPKFDDLLARARGVTDVAQRQALYRQLVDVYLADRPHIVLYHAKWLWALSDKVSGFTPTPDGTDPTAGNDARTMTTRIDGDRLLGDLYALRKIGEYKTGVHRPTYSPEDVQSRHWLAARMTEAGLEPEIDGIGNVIGRARGDGAKLLLGSHVETQPHAGWLDGALGVIYGLEVARTLGGGIDVAAWADEEGHFGSFIGSRSFCGLLPEAEIDTCRNRDGTTLRDALAQAGFAGRPRAVVDPARYRGYLEAHIEQGAELEDTGKRIGIVTAIVGSHRFRIVFEGVQNHAGTTRMAIRKDAGVALVKLASAIDRAVSRGGGTAHGLDDRANHAGPGCAEHRAGRRGDAVPVPRH